MAPEAAEPEEADVHAAPEIAVPLRAGPLRLVFDRGELRWIRLGEREVLRGVYVAVREEGWATVPAEIEDLAIEAEPESFRIRFRARHERGPVRFDWEGRVEGGADGRIVFRMAGAAGATFRRNRIGLCVLHPAEECAGRDCIVETTDGDRLEQGFPALVSPHQPFRNVRAILHEVSPGVEVEVRMEGETFETEDQRNWSDASFKTYGTPLHLPYPVEIAEGTRVEQSVSVSLFGVTAAPVRQAAATVPGALPKKRNSTEPVVVRVGAGKGVALPSIGLGGASLAALSGAEVALLRPLRPAHLRADLRLDRPGWESALETAAANGRRLDAPLEIAVLLPDDPRGALRDLAARASALRPRVVSWLVFRAGDRTTAVGDVDLARAALSGIWPEALFGGGSDAHYAELNRRRDAVSGADRVVFAASPQVHAFDDATLFENTASLGAMARTIRSFCGEASLGISPITLRPREDPRPASAREPGGSSMTLFVGSSFPRPASAREPGEPPFTDDPRQGTALAAAWTLAFASAAAEAGVASLTFFELRGPRGVVDGGQALPVLPALADVAALPGARVAPARSRRPERVRVLALRSEESTRVFLANLTADPHPVRLEGLGGAPRRVALGAPGPGVGVEGDVELAPYEIVRIEAGREEVSRASPS